MKQSIIEWYCAQCHPKACSDPKFKCGLKMALSNMLDRFKGEIKNENKKI